MAPFTAAPAAYSAVAFDDERQLRVPLCAAARSQGNESAWTLDSPPFAAGPSAKTSSPLPHGGG
jgi:hypothetical protein